MKAKLIKISNICGIESLEIEPGAVTVLEGENGSGKTSVLEALKSVFEGGHDATLLKNGTEKGEIVIVLDDGTEVRKTVKANDSALDVKHPTFGRISQPATFLKKLSDSLSINPIEFLRCDEKKRATYLLEALPLKVTPEDLAEISMTPISKEECEKQHPFILLASIKNGLYFERTGINRLAKDKRSSVEELKRTIPADSGENWTQKKTEVQSALQSVQEALDTLSESRREQNFAELARIEKAYNDAKASIDAQHRTALDVIHAKEQEEIDQIKAKYGALRAEHTETAKKAAEGALNAKSEAEKNQAAIMAESEAILTGHKERAAELKAELTVIDQRIQENARVESARALIEKSEKEAGELEVKSDDLTMRMEKLETLKLKLAGELPIAGIEVRDGQIYRDGVPFDRLNTAQQIEIAVKVAGIRAKDFKLICVDGIEALDSARLKEFEYVIKANDLQAIITRVVESGSLHVKNI